MSVTTRMRAAVLRGPRKIDVDDVLRPNPQPGQVLLRLQGSGLCGANLPLWQGRPWFQYPADAGAPGHEGWGVIEALGKGVSGLREGDRVAAITRNAFADYDVAEADACVLLPPKLERCDVPSEPLARAMNVLARCDVRPNQWVAIVGVGFLGALLVQLATRRGAKVIAVSRRPFSLEVARQMGARHVFALQDPDAVVREIRALTEEQLCDRVIEATGLQGPLSLAERLARRCGRLVIAGAHQDGTRQIDLGLWNKRGLTVINPHERETEMYVEGLRLAVDAMTAGTLELQPLLTHHFTLEQIHEAFEVLEGRPEGFVKAKILVH